MEDDPLSAFVAFFKPKAFKGKNVPMRCMAEGIKNGSWSRSVADVRKHEKRSPEHERQKSRLPAFMVSATTSGGRNVTDITGHSGLLQIDLDDVGTDEAPEVRDRIGEDRHILAAWISVSGDGVKAVMRIPARLDSHKASFEAAVDYMREKYGREIDPACSNLNRLCYISHDPDLEENTEAVPLPVRVPKGSRSEAGLHKQGCTGGGSTKSYVLGNKQKEHALLQHPAFAEFPSLVKLYFSIVANRHGKPQKGCRNKLVMKEIVPTCYFALNREHAVAFAMEFYRQNLDIFADYPIEDYQKEVLNVLDGCERSYLSELSKEEKQAFEELLTQEERDAFRICRSLARCESDPQFPPPSFHLASEHLGDRIRTYKMDAWRILQGFVKQGILECVDRGKARSKGTMGKTAVFRWRLLLMGSIK